MCGWILTAFIQWYGRASFGVGHAITHIYRLAIGGGDRRVRRSIGSAGRADAGPRRYNIIQNKSNSQMKPTSAKIKFVVPSPSILRPIELDASSQKWRVRSFLGVFMMFGNDNWEKFTKVLQFDEKWLKPGLTETHGDIDCQWRTTPILSDRKNQHQLNKTLLKTYLLLPARQWTKPQGIPYFII